jgi:hypothetical protein
MMKNEIKSKYIYLEYINADGSACVEQHLVWDDVAFIQSKVREGIKNRDEKRPGHVEVKAISQAEYFAARK